MKDLTRREFIHTMAGAAVSGTIVGHDTFIHNETVDASSTASSENVRACVGACPPIESVIFPKPQEISSSGSNFLLDDQVRIVVPAEASEQDLLLASLL